MSFKFGVKFTFKLVTKDMMYLEIILSQNIEEMPTLNFKPMLQKIKNNLDKWGKLKLTLCGISVLLK